MIYDDVYRLISETLVDDGDTAVTTYGYDPNNNRLGKSVQVNGGTVANTTFVLDGAGLNQLVQVQNPDTSTVDFTYDDNGNRITKTDADGVDTYSYDYENRLIALDDKVSGGATESYAYAYDYRTRRVTRDESAAASGDTTRLVFSAGLSIQEYDNEAPATGTPVVETIRGSGLGGGIGGVLYTLRNGTPSYNHYNNRGDVVAKTDATGSLTYQAGYEAFGTRTREDGSTEDRQKANTKDEDPWGGLNEGMRYRDLEFGVWLTRDPLGFVDGPNLYAYVRQNPWSSFDPKGLATVTIFGDNVSDANEHQKELDDMVETAQKNVKRKKVKLNPNDPGAAGKALSDELAELAKSKDDIYTSVVVRPEQTTKGTVYRIEKIGAGAGTEGTTEIDIIKVRKGHVLRVGDLLDPRKDVIHAGEVTMSLDSMKAKWKPNAKGVSQGGRLHRIFDPDKLSGFIPGESWSPQTGWRINALGVVGIGLGAMEMRRQIININNMSSFDPMLKQIVTDANALSRRKQMGVSRDQLYVDTQTYWNDVYTYMSNFADVDFARHGHLSANMYNCLYDKL